MTDRTDRVAWESDTFALTKLMLDVSPFSCIVWDDALTLLDCNAATLTLLDIGDKSDLLNNFFAFSVPIQENGQFAGEYAREMFDKALTDSEVTFIWQHKNSAQVTIPAEITLKKILFQKSFRFIWYIRDLRAEYTAHAQTQQAIERNQMMIDATPICFSFWDDAFQLIDCNNAAINLFGQSNKQAFIDHYQSFVPPLQPDGSRSAEQFTVNMQRAINDGTCVFEWMYRIDGQSELPVEITLKRLQYKNGYAIACYARDLREYKAMMQDIRKAEEKLVFQREQALESARAKGEFLANMSHEIRTPMNGILGITNLILKTDINQRQLDYLQKIDRSAKSLLRIINDILDFSKIEAGKLEMETREFRLFNVLQEVQNITAFSAAPKNLTVSYVPDESINFHLIGDALRLQQIILNICNNAIKFTDSGFVRISVSLLGIKDNDAIVQFSIQDTGIGMTPEQAQKVFQPFNQAESSTTRKFGGTGLGLTISKTLVELMNGKIWCESQVGVGSTFHFTAQFGVGSPITEEAEREANEDFVIPEDIKGARILLAEDVDINQLIAVELLESIGLVVEVAENGRLALDALERSWFDLVLMDVQMPVMDGFEATVEIRKNPKHQRLPVIAMTANAFMTDKAKSIAVGMNDHITKPIEPRFMYETIVKWIRISRKL